MTTLTTKTLTVAIEAPFDQVTRDLADPTNHPEWGTEFFKGPAWRDDQGSVWANVPAMGGRVRFSIEATPEHGLIDLYLRPDDHPLGVPLPVRVIRNGSGVDVLWTLAKPPQLNEDVWQKGLALMARELILLKKRLEG